MFRPLRCCSKTVEDYDGCRAEVCEADAVRVSPRLGSIRKDVRDRPGEWASAHTHGRGTKGWTKTFVDPQEATVQSWGGAMGKECDPAPRVPKYEHTPDQTSSQARAEIRGPVKRRYRPQETHTASDDKKVDIIGRPQADNDDLCVIQVGHRAGADP